MSALAGDGFIDGGEIQRVLNLHGIQLPEQHISDQMLKFDVNGTGKAWFFDELFQLTASLRAGCIDFFEFVQLSTTWLSSARSELRERC